MIKLIFILLLTSKPAGKRRSGVLKAIVIGTRENSKNHLTERNQLSEEFQCRVHIRSYDHLTEELAARTFRNFCSPYWTHSDEETLTKLANPFFKAFSDKSWRTLIQRLEQSSFEGPGPQGLGGGDMLILAWDS